MKPYEEMSNAELSEAFALEVAGMRHYKNEWWHSATPIRSIVQLPDFATSADAVLPWLCNGLCSWGCDSYIRDIIQVRVEPAKNFPSEPFTATAGGNQFARAACIALLKAKKSETAT